MSTNITLKNYIVFEDDTIEIILYLEFDTLPNYPCSVTQDLAGLPNSFWK